MIKLADILNEVEQDLSDQDFVELFRKRVQSRKGTMDDSLFNRILAGTQSFKSKVEIVEYLHRLIDTTKDGKQIAYLKLLIQDCNSNFKPRWDFSNMKTIRK